MALSTDYTWTWSVTSLKKADQVNSEGVSLSGAVVQTYWKAVATAADGKTAEFSGATPFTAVNVPAGSFTAFETLTEETVLGWIQAVVNADQGYADHISDRVRKEIEAASVVEAPMPWAPEDVTPVPPVPGQDPAALADEADEADEPE